MNIKARSFFTFTLLVALVALTAPTGCGSDNPPSDENESDAQDEQNGEQKLHRMFPTEENPGEEYSNCVFTSPIHYEEDDDSWIVVGRADGTIEALDPETGAAEWSVRLPESEKGARFLLADPARIGDRLVYGYHAIPDEVGKDREPNDRRLAHLVAVVDLAEREVDDSFPAVELEAEVEANEPGETVPFKPRRALTRPKLVHGAEPGDELGKVYLGQGNTGDTQPWHGWGWEVDLDVWREEGAEGAITGVFNTTPEPDEDCGEPGTSGSRERLCGGGLWAPSGHLVVERGDSYRVVLAPGNGQLNLNDRNYANTLLKTRPGLEFEPACDEEACANFDPDAPAEECMNSCENVFIPRLMPDQEVPKPTDGRCSDRETMFSCWEEMDYIGGSTPVYLETENHELLAYPTKDGHTYLVDWEHFGTMHDRHEMVELCGSNDGRCRKFWAGMSVTKPMKTEIDGEEAILVPTFMPDKTNPAGVVAMKVVETDDGPRLERAWEFPDFESDRAVKWFRNHPSRLALGPHGPEGGDLAWIVDIRSDQGVLAGFDPTTGEPHFETKLTDRGRRFSVPLTTERRVYVTSCHGNRGPSHVEGYEIREEND